MHKLRFRQVHLDFHTSPEIPEIGVKFDKKQWQDRLKKAHVDSITCFSSCHHGMSYHPTKVGMMHPNLKFNLLRAQMDACKEIDVNVPVYLTAGVNNYAASLHPEWREVNSDGTYAGWVQSPLEPGFMKMCFNTPYLDYLCEMIRETVTMFPEADGIFLDIITQGPCCCPWCLKSMYREGFDPQLPADRIAHARKVLVNYYKRTFEAVRSVDPKMPIFHNSGDIRIGDHEILPYFSHLELESLPTGGWGYDHYPMCAAYSRNLGLDFLGMTGKFHKTWGEFGGFKHPNALRYECAAMIANNSKCSVGDQLHPSGELDESTYEIIGEAYSHVEQCEPWCKDALSAAEIAVVADENPDHKQNSNVGASRLLLELHLPFDFVDSGMEFGKYKCLIVADETELSDALRMKLKMFLSNGGRVVFAGDSLLQAATVQEDIRSVEWRVEHTDSTAICYGVTMDPSSGIVVDNFSTRGSSGQQLGGVPMPMLRAYNRLRTYDLIVLQYGLNVASEGITNYRYYTSEMVKVINRLKEAFPQASFLLVSIGDRESKDETGKLRTMPGVKNLVRYQQALAAETHIAFWNLYEAMGGEGSIVKMVESKPQMANYDYTHINFRGGKHLAELLFETLMYGKEQHEKRKAYENE